ncbi:hypothetical protein KBY93_11960 [Synechococcus sp. J7-Johnson]|nr:hypothetical protein [Synechococcus sp. J7-Johnson]
MAVLLVITWFTGARLLNEGLHAHIYDFGNEALRAVQAWENHGFFSMGGMYPWGRGYFDAASFPQTIYRSKTPLALLPLWLGYRLVGESGFHLFKLYWSLAVVLLMGLLLAAIATSCFASRRVGDRQLVFASTYAIAITNEALLRYCLVDEPQYLGLFLHLLGVFLLLKWLRGPTARAAGLRGVIGVFFLASWTYPILGGINAVIAMGLKRLRPDRRLRWALGAIGLASLLGPVLYFLQRWTVSAMFPDRLVGQRLPTRMGFTPDNNFHDGVFDALNFLFWQKSGETLESSGVAPSHAIEHYAVWILGMVLFVLCLSRIRRDRQLLLILSAGQMWLFIPLFHQTLSQHPWIYGLLFTPTVVLGWVGAPTLLLPHRPGDSFPAFVMVGVAVLIWAIQLRFFLVNYLG